MDEDEMEVVKSDLTILVNGSTANGARVAISSVGPSGGVEIIVDAESSVRFSDDGRFEEE